MKLLSSRLVTFNNVAMVIGSVFSLGLLASPGLSATYSVTNTLDSGKGSLRQAINEANASPGADEIKFNLPSGKDMQTVLLGGGQIEISDRLTITGPGRDLLTIRGVNPSSRRLFRVNLQTQVTMTGLTIANSQNSGGAIGNFGKLEIRDSAFKGNISGNDGTIVNGSAGDSATAITLTLKNVEFSNNANSNMGGAINNFAIANIKDCTFNSNRANFGGAIYNQKSGTLDVKDSLFTRNRAGNAGGDIANDGKLTGNLKSDGTSNSVANRGTMTLSITKDTASQ